MATGLEASSVDIASLQIRGTLADLADVASGSLHLAVLASVAGVVRASIRDAQFLFDADVTVPIRSGRIDFHDATVEHVGPDSRMGISRLGLYVEAPHGRTYLYQFEHAPIAGVEYEKPAALPGPWVSDRGKLELQPFAESLLRQAQGASMKGFTEQARRMFERTTVNGEIALGDGPVAVGGMQAEFTGRAQGRNTVRIHSQALARGVTVEMPALSLARASATLNGTQAACEAITAGVTLRLYVEAAGVRFELDLANVKVSGLRLQPSAQPEDPTTGTAQPASP
jgi:hypothetical protein